jgi:hypothetical protein
MRCIYAVVLLIVVSAANAYTDAQIDAKINNIKTKISDLNNKITASNSLLTSTNSKISTVKSRIDNPNIQFVSVASPTATVLCPTGYRAVSCFLGGVNGRPTTVPVTGVAGPYTFVIMAPTFEQSTARLEIVSSNSNPRDQVCRCYSTNFYDPTGNYKCTATCMKI